MPILPHHRTQRPRTISRALIGGGLVTGPSSASLPRAPLPLLPSTVRLRPVEVS